MCVNLCVDENDYLLIKKEFGDTELCPATLSPKEAKNVKGEMCPEIRDLLSEMIELNKRVNYQLTELIKGIEHQHTKEILKYAIKLPNTRDRANCMRWSLKCIKKEFGPKETSLAASVELIHLATLIADEIFDKTDTCGKEDAHGNIIESTWKKFKSKGQAFSAADILISLAIKNVVEICKSGDAYDKIPSIIDKLSQTIRENYTGQVMDLKLQSGEEALVSEYFEMISTLEGKPLQLAIEAGLFYAGASEQEIKILGECGYILGMMFKLRNDIIDIIGHEKALGKDTADDIKIELEDNKLKMLFNKTKKTLPIIHVIKKIKEKKELKINNNVLIKEDGEIDGTNDSNTAKLAIIKYLKGGIIKDCEEELRALGGRVLEKLYTLPPNDGRSRLERLTQFVGWKFSLR